MTNLTNIDAAITSIAATTEADWQDWISASEDYFERGPECNLFDDDELVPDEDLCDFCNEPSLPRLATDTPMCEACVNWGPAILSVNAG